MYLSNWKTNTSQKFNTNNLDKPVKTMKILIGTTNPAKIRRFADLLSDFDIEFLTLNDLGIELEPPENGNSRKPTNAIIKAKFTENISRL